MQLSCLIRQYNEENKRRKALASPEYIAAKRPEGEEEDTPDDASTEGGVLHEEHFHEIKMPGNKAVPMVSVTA